MACDDVVLKSGLSPSTYAGELVECVRQSRNKAVALATVAMADKNSVSVRVHAVLETGRNRSQIRRIVAVTAGIVGLIVTVVVGATWTGRAAQGSEASSIDKQPIQMTCTLIYPNGKPATDATLFVYYSKSGTQEPSSHSYKPDLNGVVRFAVERDPSLFIARTIFATSPTGCALWFRPTFSNSSTCILQPFTSVRVHLIDTGGKPLVGVRVSPAMFTNANSSSDWSGDIPGTWTQTTDEAGAATIPDLPQGYNVTFAVLDDRYYSPGFNSEIQLATTEVTPDATITAGPASTITGSVLYSPTGAPVRGINVMASSGNGFRDATTDEHGVYTISRLQPGLYTVVEESRSGDFKSWIAQAQQVNVGDGTRTSIPAISLTHGGLITGNVLDSTNGKPVPNINVFVVPEQTVGNVLAATSSAVTGPDGSYSIRTTPGVVSVSAFSPTAQDNSRTSAHLSIGEGETKTVNLSLAAPVQPKPVHGIVVGPDGNPVRGAVITIFQSHTDGTVVSDSRGAFVIDSPGLVPKATLRAEAGDLAMADPLTYSSGSRIVLRLAKKTFGSLTGQIEDEDGKPIPGAHASLSALGVWTVMTCDSQGHFAFPNVYGNTSYIIGADAPGYADSHTLEIRVADGQTVPVPTLVLTKTDNFAGGTVVDAEGKPVANAVVRSSDSGQLTSQSSTTDAAGRFSLQGVGRRSASVWVQPPTGGSSHYWLNSGQTDNVITLPDVVHGIAIAPDGGPVPGAQIITPQDWEGGNLITTDRQGRFTLASPGLMPKETVIARSRLFSTAQPASYNGGNQMVLHLTPGNLCTIQGEILDGNGKPVVGADVTLMWLDSNSGYPVDQVKSNARGEYVFRSAFGNSKYNISVQAEGYSRGDVSEFRVGLGQRVTVPVMILQISDSFVGGQVIDAAGHPVANATVMDLDIRSVQTVTDVQGRFILHGVPRGKTNVQVQSGIHFRQSKLISGRIDNVFHML